ncbi:hypothetical protein GGS26DRAFT_602037 [Hypomontagnella submonticulosa]|nr:hypothetical protein GGS26DRAFT_602037 [Hypomontagnella submonticulosa]
MSASGLGPFVRLWGLPTDQLPAATASTDDLAPLLTAILQEAVPFIDSAAPKSGPPDPKLWKSKGVHAHPDSAARVEVLERVVPAADLERVAAAAGGKEGLGKGKAKAEAWCCRRSVHDDAAKPGTARWEEFVRCFREEHAASERAFTPDCTGAHRALSWACGGVEAREAGVDWAGFTLIVEEMRHRVGRPVLKDRTFPVLQMACGAAAGDEFLVVSIPVPDFGEKAGESSRLASEKGALVAVYVSVERIRRMEGGRIEWLMATASDAGGALPAWVQNLAAPAVIWKDVPLFLGWIAKERGKGEGKGSSAGQGGKIGDGKAVPQPTVSDGINNAEPAATETPQVSTGNEVTQTTKVSESG